MIDVNAEELISLSEALRILPPGRCNKRPHLSTILRWILTGVDGVRLEACRLGGRWLTSRQEIQRFVERLTPDLADCPPAAPRAPAARRRASERAARELKRIGV